MVDLYSELRRTQSLTKAWRVVRASAMRSSSAETRNEASEFDADSHSRLRSIQDKLRRKTFKFKPQYGIAKQRDGKSARPLVISPIENRIVQRAILDVLQGHVEPIQDILNTPTSFGGIRRRRVSMAISALKERFVAGDKYHIRSDIPSFFTRVSKPDVMKYMGTIISDVDFLRVFEMGITTTLENLTDLQRAKVADLFPLGAEGVAQGSPLSPLIANIYLREFDRKMNSGEVACIRYIDDFVITAKTEQHAKKAFKLALLLLKRIGLDAYSPSLDKGKASSGLVVHGFEFLGCHITPGLVQPGVSARRKLIDKVDAEVRRAIAAADTIISTPAFIKAGCYTQALTNINNIVWGWGKAFSFCNGNQVLVSLDKIISKRLDVLEQALQKRMARTDYRRQRMMLGVRLLEDSNKIK